MSANRSLSGETLKDYRGRGIEDRLVKARKNLNANTRPSLRPRIHLLRGEPHTGEPTWGTRGARAANLPATLTLYPRAAPVAFGGKTKKINVFSFSANS